MNLNKINGKQKARKSSEMSWLQKYEGVENKNKKNRQKIHKKIEEIWN